MNPTEVLTALRDADGWKKSRRSQGQGGCVEVTTEIPEWVEVRDTKLGPTSPILAITNAGWTALLAAAKVESSTCNTATIRRLLHECPGRTPHAIPRRMEQGSA